METALDDAVLSFDSPCVTVSCLKLLSCFCACSLSLDSCEAVTVRWKNEFGEIGLSHVLLQQRGGRQQLKASWQNRRIGVAMFAFILYLVLDSQISIVFISNLNL